MTLNRRTAYSIAVLVGGATALAVVARDAVAADWSAGVPLDIFVWTVLVIIATNSPIPMPRTGTSLRLSPVVDVAALVIFGPAPAAGLGILARVVGASVAVEHRFHAMAERVGTFLIALSAAAFAFGALGGRTGQGLLLHGNPFIPVLVAGLVYVLALGLIEAAGEAVEMRTHDRRSWTTALRLRLPFDAAVLPFGFFLVQTQLQIGTLGTAIFLVPVLFSRHAMRLWQDSRSAHVTTVRTLMRALDASDPFTRGHSTRIAAMAVRVARHLGRPARELEQIEYAAMLHDFGRTAIRRELLNKPGRLDAGEQSEVHAHPRIAAELIGSHHFYREAAGIVLHHHEQPDGRGYPDGLRGDAIPLGSQIIMAVSAFDAMTSDRPYRRGLPPETAFEELLANCGTQFSPDVVEALVELFASGELFADLAEEELDEQTGGEHASRAVADLVGRTTGRGSVPRKRAEDAEPPILELPAPALSRADETWGVRTAASGALRVTVSASSDVGCVRADNEDRFAVETTAGEPGRMLLVVADGMGGAAAGEVASGMTVETMAERLLDADPSMPATDILREAIAEANTRVHARAAANPAQAGMGTTCTAALLDTDGLWLGHVGDSRAYLVTAEGVTQLTQDHTLLSELGKLAGGGPIPEASSHVLTRCVGAMPSVEIDVTDEAIELAPGDAIVLCSDGLTGVLEPEEIADLVRDAEPRPAADALVGTARERGGPDNITVVVVRIDAAA